MHAFKNTQSLEGWYMGFALFDKKKQCCKLLRCKVADEQPYYYGTNSFDECISLGHGQLDLSISLAEDEHYVVEGNRAEYILDGLSLELSGIKMGHIDDLSRHLNAVGNTAALVVEFLPKDTYYLFPIVKANLKQKSAVVFKGELMKPITNKDIFYVADFPILRIAPKEVIFLDKMAASKYVPILEKSKEIQKKIVQSLSSDHERVFAPIEWKNCPKRNLTMLEQIPGLVAEMGEDAYLAAVKKAIWKSLSEKERNECFDTNGRIRIDLSNERILNICAENQFTGILSKNTYIALSKQKAGATSHKTKGVYTNEKR